MTSNVSLTLKSREQYASMIDSTLLAAGATRAQIEALVDEAIREGFGTVCINPRWVGLAANRLRDASSPVRVCTVIGFPLGANTTNTKVHEALEAQRLGAAEFDMVADLGAIADDDWDAVAADIAAVVIAVQHGGETSAVVKVILETCYFDESKIRQASKVAKSAGADFVKTSTGFAAAGATVDAVRWMRDAVGPSLGVKAAGGIRTAEAFLAMLGAGATRVGASAGATILDELDATR